MELQKRELPALPPGSETYMFLGHAKLASGERVITFSIGRPHMEETAAGEMVASYYMGPEQAKLFGLKLFNALALVEASRDET